MITKIVELFGSRLQNNMKNYLFLILSLLSFCSFADVKLTISDGISNKNIISKIESNSSQLLTEINNAQLEGRDLNFMGMDLDFSVQESLSMLWNNSPFICTDPEIVEHCITTSTGYQVRNIPLLMKPKDPANFRERGYQEAVISFDKWGNIESFYLAISNNLYVKIMRENPELKDVRRRQLILDYIEQFRTSYNKKDLKFLKQVFSDDALIIVGKVIKSRTAEKLSHNEEIIYNNFTKQEYITHLSTIFRRNESIRVTFDDIEIKIGSNTDFYGVTLRQGYTSTTYSDDGYLFLLWDFRDESMPQIHVRTWQPEKVNGKPLDRNEIFNLSDFDIK